MKQPGKRVAAHRAFTFDQAFDVAVEVSYLKKESAVAIGPQRQRLEVKIRRFEGMITPYKRQKAAAERREIIAACRTWINQNGLPENITQFTKELRQAQLLNRTRQGNVYPISDATVRDILRNVLNIRGRRGRKPSRRKDVQ